MHCVLTANGRRPIMHPGGICLGGWAGICHTQCMGLSLPSDLLYGSTEYLPINQSIVYYAEGSTTNVQITHKINKINAIQKGKTARPQQTSFRLRFLYVFNGSWYRQHAIFMPTTSSKATMHQTWARDKKYGIRLLLVYIFF